MFNLVGVYSSCTNTRDHTADKVWLCKVVYMHTLLRLSTMNGRNIPCACVCAHMHVCVCVHVHVHAVCACVYVHVHVYV